MPSHQFILVLLTISQFYFSAIVVLVLVNSNFFFTKRIQVVVTFQKVRDFSKDQDFLKGHVYSDKTQKKISLSCDFPKSHAFPKSCDFFNEL